MKIELSRSSLLKIGFRMVALIRERTLKGIDSLGKPFKAYGTEPFARPLKGIPKKVLKALGEDGVSYFKKDGKATWVVIENGYVAYKAALRPNDNGEVNLSDTGRMLGSLKPIIHGNVITIGFTREEEAEKAYWHEESGAGKSRVIRKFLGLTDEEIKDDEIISQIYAGITITT